MNKSGFGRWLVMATAAFALMAGLIAAPGMATAQDMASPVAGEHNHPAHIHTGTCDAVGEVVFPLNNVSSESDAGTPESMDDMATPDTSMDDMGTPEAGMDAMDGMDDYVAESTTTITATFDDIFAAEHVVNVHESEANIGNYIACGAITGTPTDGELTIALDQMNDSGWQGEAMFVDNGDGTIDVTVRLMAAEMDMSSPEASPEA